jgi:hypothetical protein
VSEPIVEGSTAQRALEAAQKANGRIDGHEDLCGVRYGGLLSRLARVELMLYAIVGLLLIGEGTIGALISRLLPGR